MATVFGLLSAISPTVEVLMVVRFFVGIGVGSTPAAIVLYTVPVCSLFSG